MTAIWWVSGQQAKVRPRGAAVTGAAVRARPIVEGDSEIVAVTRTSACAIAFIPVSLAAGRSTALVVAASVSRRVSARKCAPCARNVVPARLYSKTDARPGGRVSGQSLTDKWTDSFPGCVTVAFG